MKDEDALYELALRTVKAFEDLKPRYRLYLERSWLDGDRILAKLDQLRGYLEELRPLVPPDLEANRAPGVRRACERLLQISIEAAIGACGLLVAGLRLGLPAEEDDLVEKVATAGVVTEDVANRLRRMKGLRNILVHGYAWVDDRIVFETLRSDLPDLELFLEQVGRFLREQAAR